MGRLVLVLKRRQTQYVLHGVGLLLLAWRWWHYVSIPPSDPYIGVDFETYWSASLEDPYSRPVGEAGAYLYTPAFLQVLAPLRALPLEFAWPIWIGLNLGALAYCVTPLPAAVLSIVWAVDADLFIGNIHSLMAAAMAVASRYPAAWAVLLLTKLTPGIGVLWYALRREWSSFAVALGATAATALISIVLAPEAWSGWIEQMTSDSNRAGALYLAVLLGRLAAAVSLLAYGAWRNLPVVVPIAATIAVPVVWPSVLILLVAAPRWWRLGPGLPTPQRNPASTSVLSRGRR